MKEFFKKLWEKIKAWAVKTALPWLKKSWMQIVNILVVAIAYADTDSLPELQLLIAIWLFILLGYYIFWKLLGVDKIVKKFIEERKKKDFDPQPEPPGKNEPLTPSGPTEPSEPVDPNKPIDIEVPDLEIKAAVKKPRKPKAKV